MQLKALTFDIIGTVFDVYDGLAQGVGPLNAKYGVSVAGAAFASGSLSGYSEGIGQVLSSGNWVPPDTILQNATRANLPVQQLGAKADAAVQDFAGLWHALPPWPDVAAGMAALHRHYTLAVLSNMSVATQSALRAHANLPFDKLLSAETVQHYKPDPAVYQMAIASLGVAASEIPQLRLGRRQGARLPERLCRPAGGAGAGWLTRKPSRSELRLQRDQPDRPGRAAWRLSRDGARRLPAAASAGRAGPAGRRALDDRRRRSPSADM
jgi:2-haloacid dehalogenase